MIDLDSLRHRPPVPVPASERTTKSASGDYTVTPTAWGEIWEPTASAQRSAKAAPLPKGARSVEEGRILAALRKAPASSIADLARTTRLPELAVDFAWRAMMHRGGLVREEAGMLGTVRLVAVALSDD